MPSQYSVTGEIIMTHFKLLIGYCLFFTVCNLLVSLFYYLYGFFAESKLRDKATLKALPDKLLFLYHFKGINKSDKSMASKAGAFTQMLAILYFIIMEIACLALTKLLKTAVIPCRIAIFMLALLIICGIIIIIINKNGKRK